MAEYKDMHSSPPARAPKLQLTAEQLLTGGCWNIPKKKIPHIQRQSKTRVRALGWEDPLEKEMAMHSRTIAWKIPWTGEPGRLQSMGSQKVGHDWATSLHFTSLT